MKKLEIYIKKIPGGSGWYKKSTYDTYLKNGKKLMSLGVKGDEVCRILDDLFWATGEEFGN